MQIVASRRSRLLLTFLSFTAVVFTASVHAADALPKVPEGFTIEKVAASPLVKYPMMGGFDDRGRLFLAASAGKNVRAAGLLEDPPNFIQMLEDTDHDGLFDKSTVFADKITFPMGALWHRGALYVAAPPNIWRFEDTDDDGVADKREILVDQFGFSGNGASVHGCFLGPNGRIYWCDGRHGHEFTDKDGNVISKGKAARVFSCRPDGSDVQVFAGGGMDNPVEVDFTPEGEMLGVINIMIGRPRGDTLVHWMDGGVYPRFDQENCIAEFQRTGDLLPAVVNFGHVAVSGMTRYRSDHFGPKYKNNLFISIFNTHKVYRAQLSRSGATYHCEYSDFLVSENPDFHATDVIEDADGSLLVIDTGGWFRIGCPTSQVAKPEVHGAIYRIRRKGGTVWKNPRGENLKLDREPSLQLVGYLNDPRPAVRERAIDLLSQQGDKAVDVLKIVVKHNHSIDSQSVDHRRNAVWALSRIDSKKSLAAIRTALGDESESVRISAARSLGTARDRQAILQLAKLVVSDTPPVRRQAATALGRICKAGRQTISDLDRRTVIDLLFAGLATSSNDRFLEHAQIMAVIRIADREKTTRYLDSRNPQVRRAALIALDQMDGGNLTRELVTPLLDTDDPALQKQALEIISEHDGWASETLSLLRKWLDEKQVNAERVSMLRGILLAQSDDVEIQQLLSDSFTRNETSESVRSLLLEVMYRAVVDPWPASWMTVLKNGLSDHSSDVRLESVRVIRDRGIELFDARLQQLAHDDNQPAELRVEAIFALSSRLGSADRKLFDFLLARFDSRISPLMRLSAARAIAEIPLDDSQLVELAGNLDAAGPLAVPVMLRAFSRSQSEQVGLAMVEALNASSASANLSAEELASVLGRYPTKVQNVGGGLLKKLGVDFEKQRAHLNELSELLDDGNSEQGRQIFFGKKAACAGCHTIAGKGGKVGPDLSRVGRIRTGRDLTEAIAFPSASFAREFRTYQIVTDQGKIYTGVISRQTTDALYLRTAELAEIRIPRDSIDEMKESATSIMPKGLEKILTKDELRNLLSYLQGLK